MLVGLALAVPVLAQTTLRVGVYENPPKILLGADGRVSGLLGDVLGAMAEREGWIIEPVPCEWQACLDALATGRIDLMPDVAWNNERAERFDFHATPALLSWSQLYKSHAFKLQSVFDLRGKRIAVVRGSVQASYLRGMLDGFAIDALLVEVSSFEEGFQSVAQGRADAVAANRFFGDLAAPGHGLEASVLVFQPAQLFYAAPKGAHINVLAAIDRHLNDWQARGGSPYSEALARWMRVETPPAVPDWLWWVLGALGGALLLGSAWVWTLRREFARHTAALRESEAWLSSILDNVDAHIYIKDAQLRYRYANRQMCKLVGQPRDAIIGRGDDAFFDAATCARLRTNDLRVIEERERVEAEEVNRLSTGGPERYYLSVKMPLIDASGVVYALCGISTDITRRKHDEEAIHRLAYYDALTGLPNRRLLLDRLDLQLAAMQRMPQSAALLFIDLDNFKDVNDTLGHAAGDAMLCEVAQRIGRCIGVHDSVARVGGDGFAALLVELSTYPQDAAHAVQRIADKMIADIDRPVVLGPNSAHASISIGVALLSGGQHPSREEILKQADLALDHAKAAGRHTARFFDPAMQAQMMARTQLEAELRLAFQRDELILYAQPQVRDDASLLGYEALVRWRHPTRGLVSPAEFIPVAEESGLIVPLGDWVLRRACEVLASWACDSSRQGLTLAVNVSAPQFHLADYVDRVRDALASTGASGHQLILELTESQLVHDVEGVVTKMDALKALGVRLSLDDFGTGYSSLAMIRRLPLDELKIDISFVRAMRADSRSAALVNAIVRMGDALAMAVIAEGVEEQAQHDALLALGCSRFQGYLYGHPAPLDEVGRVAAPA